MPNTPEAREERERREFETWLSSIEMYVSGELRRRTAPPPSSRTRDLADMAKVVRAIFELIPITDRGALIGEVVMQCLGKGTESRNTLSEILPLREFTGNDIITSMGNASTILQDVDDLDFTREALIAIPPGESRGLPNGEWAHHCKECGYVWVSINRRPYTCANRQVDETGKQVCQTVQWYKGSGPRRRHTREYKRHKRGNHSLEEKLPNDSG